MSGTVKTVLAIAIVAVVGYVGLSIKTYIDNKAEYASLQRDLEEQRRDNAAVLEDVAALRAMVRDDSLVIAAVRAERDTLKERNDSLLADSLELGHKLTEARAARHKADEIVAQLRQEVDEDRLHGPVLRLLVAERAAGDKARDEADRCDAFLTNCEQRVSNLQGQIGALETESQTLQKDLDSAMVNVTELQRVNAGLDTTVTKLNKQIKPNFWKSLTSTKFLEGVSIGGLIGALVTMLVGG